MWLCSVGIGVGMGQGAQSAKLAGLLKSGMTQLRSLGGELLHCPQACLPPATRPSVSRALGSLLQALGVCRGVWSPACAVSQGHQ